MSGNGNNGKNIFLGWGGRGAKGGRLIDGKNIMQKENAPKSCSIIQEQNNDIKSNLNIKDICFKEHSSVLFLRIFSLENSFKHKNLCLQHEKEHSSSKFKPQGSTSLQLFKGKKETYCSCQIFGVV